MNINTPLLSLDVIGGEDNAVLKANKTEMLCRGSKEYCLTLRNSILEARGYTVPEDWDLKWGHQMGSTWKPNQLGTDVLCWLTPASYSLTSDGSNATDIVEWDDISASDIKFANGAAADKQPHEGNEVNGFKGAVFDGSNDYLEGDAHADGDEFDSGTGDFMYAMFIKHGTDTGGENTIFTTDNTNDVKLSVSSSGADFTYKLYNNNTATTLHTGTAWWGAGDYAIVLAGWQGSQKYLKIDGKDNGIASGVTSYNVSNNKQLVLGAAKTIIGYNQFWGGTLYEFIYLGKDVTLSLENMAKIEGYLAHKYGQASLLPDDHTYKIEPPREVL